MYIRGRNKRGKSKTERKQRKVKEGNKEKNLENFVNEKF